MSQNEDYAQKLADEARLWGDEAEKMAVKIPPNWHYHRNLRHNVIMHAGDIDALLNRIQPGMKVLELGCASGWLTLAMAERGADATGLDISDQSLAVARAYYESVRASISGTVRALIHATAAFASGLLTSPPPMISYPVSRYRSER